MIEEADARFAAAMAAIHRASFAPGANWSAAAIAAELALPGTFALIDEAGAFLLGRIFPPDAEILTLAVVPSLRRQGLGGALLAAALARAKDRGARRVTLEVSVANAAARALYDRAGFRQVGVRRAYYADGADALVLAAEL